jgi:hypothetical protein
MANTVTSVPKATITKEAKAYLKQYHDWRLAASRPPICWQHGTAQQANEHQQAVNELNNRTQIVNRVKQIDQVCGAIIEYRFIKGYSVQCTLDLLNPSIGYRQFHRKQRQALLLTYKFMND